jgi:hypothetical protein
MEHLEELLELLRRVDRPVEILLMRLDEVLKPLLLVFRDVSHVEVEAVDAPCP